ncbi:hypothetical protein BH09PSE1_BH09PSE1_01700 [soil metagenome]
MRATARRPRPRRLHPFFPPVVFAAVRRPLMRPVSGRPARRCVQPAPCRSSRRRSRSTLTQAMIWRRWARLSLLRRRRRATTCPPWAQCPPDTICRRWVRLSTLPRHPQVKACPPWARCPPDTICRRWVRLSPLPQHRRATTCPPWVPCLPGTTCRRWARLSLLRWRRAMICRPWARCRPGTICRRCPQAMTCRAWRCRLTCRPVRTTREDLRRRPPQQGRSADRPTQPICCSIPPRWLRLGNNFGSRMAMCAPPP